MTWMNTFLLYVDVLHDYNFDGSCRSDKTNAIYRRNPISCSEINNLNDLSFSFTIRILFSPVCLSRFFSSLPSSGNCFPRLSWCTCYLNHTHVSKFVSGIVTYWNMWYNIVQTERFKTPRMLGVFWLLFLFVLQIHKSDKYLPAPHGMRIQMNI